MLRKFALMAVLAAPPAMADPGNRIVYRDTVTLRVGESMVVHGMRGRQCGVAPRSPRLTPQTTELGQLSLGRPGVRQSAFCNGDTPAIEVIFTARRRGSESVTLFGDRILIHVR
jgi:hypothetical protein